MPAKNVIRVSEFEKLYYDDTKPFKEKHWKALCRYLETVNKKEENRIEYFRILNKGIQFTNFVGVIQAGNLAIEVLPKIDKVASTASNENIDDLKKRDEQTAKEKGKWQKVLLDMLKECRLLRVNHVDYANLQLRSNSILDIYLELFLSEAETLLHDSLLKKYRKNEGNQTALKGQLQFPKQIASNSSHQERFYVRYTEYNRNNIYNQILYKTLCLIPNISTSSWLLDKVGRLQLDFPEVSNCIINPETFNRLQFDRKTERYKEALLISKMLLLNYRPDIIGGSENVIAILFDMNKLWEEFVYRKLKKEEANYKIEVNRQASTDFWTCDGLSRPKTIRPDILIIVDKVETLIIDTKWKIINDLIPSDDDLKQIFTYNLFWGCDKSVLLYPSMQPYDSIGDYFKFINYSKETNKCAIACVSILSDEDERIKHNFGRDILVKAIGETRCEQIKKQFK